MRSLDKPPNLWQNAYRGVEMDEGDLLTIAEAARLTGRSQQTIRNWVGRGKIKGRTIHNKAHVYSASLFREAGMPYMEEIVTLRQEYSDVMKALGQVLEAYAQLNEQVEDERRQRLRLESEVRALQVRAGLITDDDYATQAGVIRFVARHGVSEGTLKRWAGDPAFPVGQDADAILTYIQQRIEQNNARGKGHQMRAMHECTFPECACHTHQPPIAPLA